MNNNKNNNNDTEQNAIKINVKKIKNHRLKWNIAAFPVVLRTCSRLFKLLAQ